MRDNHRCRIVFQGGLHHFPWMDFGMADGAFEQRFVRNQPVLVIQQQQDKCLSFLHRQLKPQPVTY